MSFNKPVCSFLQSCLKEDLLGFSVTVAIETIYLITCYSQDLQSQY